MPCRIQVRWRERKLLMASGLALKTLGPDAGARRIEWIVLGRPGIIGDISGIVCRSQIPGVPLIPFDELTAQFCAIHRPQTAYQHATLDFVVDLLKPWVAAYPCIGSRMGSWTCHSPLHRPYEGSDPVERHQRQRTKSWIRVRKQTGSLCVLRGLS